MRSLKALQENFSVLENYQEIVVAVKRAMPHKAIQNLIRSLKVFQGNFLSLHDSQETFVSIRAFGA
jgi:hypothetical protein